MALLMANHAVTAQEVRCVNTVAELSAAAQVAADEEVEIRLVTGTYDVTQTCLDQNPLASCEPRDNKIRLRGGYNSGCTARSADPSLTVITAPGRDVDLMTPQDSADIAIDRLTFRNMDFLQPILEGLTEGNYSADIDRVWFDQIGKVRIQVDTLSFRNSIVSRSGFGTFNGPSSLEFDQGVDKLRFEGNTIVDNTRGVLCFRCAGLARNNVFWNNGFDLRPDSASDPEVNLILINNTITTISGDPLAVAPVGSSAADPLFVNAAAQNYRLQNTSPAINTGTPIGSAQTGSDHIGNVRWFGTLPDRGAFESSVGTTATTITVTNTNDSGAGSLRQAIFDANVSSNLNRIHFNIGSTCGPRIINLATPLPTITGPVVIDGYTQPGAARNTAPTASNAVRCIGLNGQGSVINGLATDTDDSVAVTIDGIGFGGFSFIALNLTGGNGHHLVGSQFGGQIGPATNLITLLPSVNGVQVGSLLGSAAAAGVDIGGPDPGERNVFSDSTDVAIRVGGGARNTNIVNNYIGVGPGGSTSTEANRDGIVIAGRYTTVTGNTISNNTRHGILVTGSNARGTEINNNRIGISALCTPLGCGSTFGNAEDGIRFDAAAADAVVDENQIRFNGDDGVVITGDAVRIAVLRNTITDNGEQPIDLSDDGASQNTNNSAPVPAGSGNFRQNRPTVASAIGQGASSQAAGIANGSLSSSNGTYRIDFYAVVDCPLPIIFGSGSPQIWLGATFATISNGTTNFDGSVSFSGIIAAAGDPDFFAAPRLIAATATRLTSSEINSQPRSTSEVSSCVLFEARLLSDGFESAN
jgi:parallel beta-helix repeat protein